MKRKLIVIIYVFLFFAYAKAEAQTGIERALREVETNNTTLSALRKKADAEKIGNKSGIYLSNPEVEFGYLWGNPSMIGNRTDISVVQTFDFPSAYKYKNRISESKNRQAELEYLKQKKEILLETRKLCNNLIYQNALKAEILKRLEHAKSIASAINTKFDVGETNILEYNKAELNVLNVGKELEATAIERSFLLSELKRLNGGIEIAFDIKNFPALQLPTDFDQWYTLAEEKNPVLRWLKNEIEISENRIKLNRAMSLPKLQTGYMSEKTVEEHFQGVTVGLSIPLWENKNTVKYAKFQSEALQSIVTDSKMQFYNRLKTLFEKAIQLQKNTNDYAERLNMLNSSDLLKKAYDKGGISLIEYMLELSIYYESVNSLLEMERELT